MNKTQHPPKSKYERAIARSLAYLRLCERRITEAVEIQKSEPEFGEIEGLAEYVTGLKSSIRRAVDRCHEAQRRYLAHHGMRCKTCGIRKANEDFHKDASSPNGYRSRCIVCEKARRG